jgi:predicted DNA-binding transcriptional regulator YafY
MARKDADRKGGGPRYELQVADLWEVKFWLIGFGAEAEVLEPAELRDEVKAECLAVVQRVHPIRGGGA